MLTYLSAFEGYLVAFVSTAVAVLGSIGPLIVAILLCRRVCKHHRWANWTAIAVGLLYLAGASLWLAEGGFGFNYLTLPFGPALEILGWMGFYVYASVTVFTCALMWGTLIYTLSAAVLLIRNRFTRA